METIERVLLMPDTHAPYHDRRAVDCFYEAAHVLQPDLLVINGDFGDFYQVSSHDKSPERRESFAEEVDLCNEELDYISGMFGRRVHFNMGNHEWRFDRYITQKAPELYGVAPSVAQMFKLKERGWTWNKYKTPLSIGKIDIVHDVNRSGKNAMHQSLEDYGHSLVIGHTHRLGVTYTGTVRGDNRVCMNIGCLLDFSQVDYMMKEKAHREWQQGFGYIDYNSKGIGTCVPVPIIAGECQVLGKVVKG